MFRVNRIQTFKICFKSKKCSLKRIQNLNAYIIFTIVQKYILKKELDVHKNHKLMHVFYGTINSKFTFNNTFVWNP